jgi:DNA repair exonuclease SbcCD ATPase subunit
MKINRVRLINWRNHTESDITLDRLTCIRGANRRGKSSIGQAIEFSITGRCDSTDARGAGAAELIRQGCDKAIIQMKLQANREVQLRCSLTEASGRTLTFADPKDADWTGDSLKQYLDAQRDVLSCVLNSHYFIGLDANAQKALLSSVIVPDSYDWPVGLAQKLDDAGIVGPSDTRWMNDSPFETIERFYKLSFDFRRDINRDLKNLRIPEPIAMPEGAPENAHERIEEVRRQLRETDAARLDQVMLASKARSQAAVLEERVRNLESKIRLEEETLANVEAMILSKKQLTEQTNIAAGDKHLADLLREQTHLNELLATIRGTITLFEGLGEKDECPVCRRDVSAEFLANALTPHKNAMEKAKQDLKGVQNAMKELGDVQGAKRKLEDHERSTASKTRCRDLISENSTLLKATSAELDELRATMPPEPAEDPAIPAMREELSKLESQLEKIALATARRDEIARAENKVAALRKASEVLEWLVQYFGPNGVKAELLASHIGTFSSAMNAALQRWGYVCSFQIEPYGFVVTNTATKATLPLRALSGSERLRFCVAFQVALAQVSEIRMVVVDEVDLLDTEGRNAFYPLLLEANLDQAIAIGTSEMREIPEVEGAVFYMVEDGKVVRLEQEALAAAG